MKEERYKIIIAIIIYIILVGGPLFLVIKTVKDRYFSSKSELFKESVEQYAKIGFKVDTVIVPKESEYIEGEYIITYFKLEGHDYILVNYDRGYGSVGGVIHNPKCKCFKK